MKADLAETATCHVLSSSQSLVDYVILFWSVVGVCVCVCEKIVS